MRRSTGLSQWRGRVRVPHPFWRAPRVAGALAEPTPILQRKRLECARGKYSSIDLGRGCPYQCSFCTIINVQGRKSRFRTPDDLEQIIRANKAQASIGSFSPTAFRPK